MELRQLVVALVEVVSSERVICIIFIFVFNILVLFCVICFVKGEFFFKEKIMLLQELLDKGGVVMIIILGLSVYVAAVILYKLFQFWRLQAFRMGFIANIIDSVGHKKYKEAQRIAGNQRSPVARVIETVLETLGQAALSEDKKMRAIESSGAKQIRVFESHLKGLEMVANIAPLLGLLGTVIGMVKAFAGIQEIGSRVDPSVLAGGIWEALLTTVAGLAVAIPALAAHYIIDNKIEGIRATMSEAVSNILVRA